MLSRVILGAALAMAGAAHADVTEPTTDRVTSTAPIDETDTEHRVDGVLGSGGAGARYRLSNERLYLEVQAFGDFERQALLGKVGLVRFNSLGVDHDIVVGAGYESTSGDAEPLTAPVMTTYTPLAGHVRGDHRFLSAYIADTVRFIRALDVTTGLVVEQWQNLGGDSTITYGSGPPMEVDTPDVSYLLSPTVSVTGHVSDRVQLVAQTLRGVHEVGPTLSLGRFAARARAFQSAELGRGVATEASVQPVAPVIATVGYLQTTDMRRAMAALTYSDPRIVSLTARYDSDRRFDALAARHLHGPLSGFVGVADLLGEERQVQFGVRGYFATGTP